MAAEEYVKLSRDADPEKESNSHLPGSEHVRVVSAAAEENDIESCRIESVGLDDNSEENYDIPISPLYILLICLLLFLISMLWSNQLSTPSLSKLPQSQLFESMMITLPANKSILSLLPSFFTPIPSFSPPNHDQISSSSSFSYPPTLLSDRRGYVAVFYAGNARSFSATFASHLLHIICSSPYTVHLYFSLMIMDDQTDFFSVRSTLDYYEGCENLDGEWIRLSNQIKGWQMQRQADVDFDNEFKELIDAYAKTGGHGLSRSAQAQFWLIKTLHNLWQAYSEKENIQYDWLVRTRFDTVHLTDIWHSVFRVQHLWRYIMDESTVPSSTDNSNNAKIFEDLINNQSYHNSSEIIQYTQNLHERLLLLEHNAIHLPDYSAALLLAGNDTKKIQSYRINDLVFTPRLSSSLLYTPSCNTHGGMNDQFAITGSSFVMTKYLLRGYSHDEIARLPTSDRFRRGQNTESFLASMVELSNIPTADMPEFCYYIVRSQHPQGNITQLMQQPFPPTTCKLSTFGIGCCRDNCPFVNSKRSLIVSTVEELSNSNIHTMEQKITILNQISLLLANRIQEVHPTIHPPQLENIPQFLKLLIPHFNLQKGLNWVTQAIEDQKRKLQQRDSSQFQTRYTLEDKLVQSSSSPSSSPVSIDSTSDTTKLWLQPLEAVEEHLNIDIHSNVRFLHYSLCNKWAALFSMAVVEADAAVSAAEKVKQRTTNRTDQTETAADNHFEKSFTATTAFEGRVGYSANNDVDNNSVWLDLNSSVGMSSFIFGSYDIPIVREAAACNLKTDGMLSSLFEFAQFYHPSLHISTITKHLKEFKQHQVCFTQPIIAISPDGSN